MNPQEAATYGTLIRIESHDRKGPHTCVTLALIPNDLPSVASLPTNITGTSPVVSVKSAIFDDEGGEGFREPAAKMPDEGSGENARDAIMPEPSWSPYDQKE